MIVFCGPEKVGVVCFVRISQFQRPTSELPDMSLIWKCLLLLALALLMRSVTGRPGGRQFPRMTSTTMATDCDLEYDILKICQTCAVSTKSNVVYPMCCTNKEEARDWCHRYINFGIK